MKRRGAVLIAAIVTFSLLTPFAVGTSTASGDNYTGEGVKVGIVDTYYNTNSTDFGDNVAATKTFGTAQSDYFQVPLKYSQHGSAVAESVYDRAPDIELHLASAEPLKVSTMNQSLEWMVQQDVDVVILSLGFWRSPMNGSGPYSQKVAELREDHNITVVVSAGNEATKHYDTSWNDPDGDGILDVIFGATDKQGIDYNEVLWAPSNNSENDSYHTGLPPGSTERIWIQGSYEDYNFSIWDHDPNSPDDYIASTGGKDGSVSYFNGTLEFQYQASADENGYQAECDDDGVNESCIEPYIRTENASSSTPGYISIFHPRGLSPVNANASILAPAAGKEVISVGAYYIGDGKLEYFSSEGPTKDGRLGIDVIAPDGFQTDCCGSFFGTSGSAPFAASIVAALYDKDPGLNPYEIEYILKHTTNQTTANTSHGYGKVNRPGALQSSNISVDSVSLTEENATATLNNTFPLGDNYSVPITVEGTISAESDVVWVDGNNTTSTTVEYPGYGNVTVDIGGIQKNISRVDTNPNFSVQYDGGGFYFINKTDVGNGTVDGATVAEYVLKKGNGDMTVNITGLPSNKTFSVYQDGSFWKEVDTDSIGQLSIQKTGNWSRHDFRVESGGTEQEAATQNTENQTATATPIPAGGYQGATILSLPKLGLPVISGIPVWLMGLAGLGVVGFFVYRRRQATVYYIE